MNVRLFSPLSICLVLAGWLMAAVAIPALPPEIPTRFGANGAVTGMSTPASLWGLPGLLTIAYAVLTALQRVPHDRLNVPVTITDRNRDRVLALAGDLARAVRVGLLVTILGVEWAAIHVAGRGALDAAVFAATALPLVALFAWITSLIVRMARA
jgi:hypothetical protein